MQRTGPGTMQPTGPAPNKKGTGTECQLLFQEPGQKVPEPRLVQKLLPLAFRI